MATHLRRILKLGRRKDVGLYELSLPQPESPRRPPPATPQPPPAPSAHPAPATPPGEG
jgi:hypothetical protein